MQHHKKLLLPYREELSHKATPGQNILSDVYQRPAYIEFDSIHIRAHSCHLEFQIISHRGKDPSRKGRKQKKSNRFWKFRSQRCCWKIAPRKQCEDKKGKWAMTGRSEKERKFLLNKTLTTYFLGYCLRWWSCHEHRWLLSKRMWYEGRQLSQ